MGRWDYGTMGRWDDGTMGLWDDGSMGLRRGKPWDDGTTGLGGGQRVSKDSARIAAHGAVDELNAAIGVALVEDLDPRIDTELRRVQNELFHLGSDLCVLEKDKEAMPVPTIDERHVVALEATMDELSDALEPLQNFILPGGSEGAAHLHVARTICRRTRPSSRHR